VQGREIQDLIKPSTRLIHSIFEKLKSLGPGQYILGHTRFDMNATLYKAAEDGEPPGSTTSGASKASQATNLSSTTRARYDLHAAHQASPQLLNDSTDGSNGGGSSGSGGSGAIGGEYVDDELQLRWVGTPDQVPGTFPYSQQSEPSNVPTHPQKPKPKPKPKAKARAKTKAKAKAKATSTDLAQQ
jgi:hypothetical protein